MSQFKTLGGDRLGAGKKMKVELHGYERSTHDLGRIIRTTMSAGTLIPFYNKIILPGDTWDIDLELMMNTHPTIGPLFGSYKVQLDMFVTPIRLYNAMLHNNTLNIGRDMSKVKLPQIELTALPTNQETWDGDKDNSQINPSCLLAYIGIRGVGIAQTLHGAQQRQFNAVSILNYWDIVKQYYANKQEEIGAVIHTPSVALVETITQVDVTNSAGNFIISQAPAIASRLMDEGGNMEITWVGATPHPEQVTLNTSIGQITADQLFDWTVTSGTTMMGQYKFDQFGEIHILNWDYISATTPKTGLPEISTFPLENIDLMRKEVLALWDDANALVINDADLEPYKWLYEQPGGMPNALSSQEGLALKTYQSDLFNNWLKTENIEEISTRTAVDTTGNSFSIDQLIVSKKVWEMLNRINVSGGSYDDWLDAVYDTERMRRAESPAYVGGLIKELVFQEVISNTESGDQPLGTIAGKGTLGSRHKGGSVVVKADEPSYLMGIISLTPRIDYSQGNEWDVHLRTLDDLHKPALDQIGFQDVITEQMAWWDSIWNGSAWVQKSAGKQPAWINYMTDVNKTFGNFAMPDNEMFMTLNRRYEGGEGPADGIADLTTYIDPSKFNFIFAETALDSQNFWCQIKVDATARRKMSAKVMPNL